MHSEPKNKHSRTRRAFWFLPFVGVLALAATSRACQPRSSVTHPTFENGGLVATGTPLTSAALKRLEGMWKRGAGADVMGQTVAVHATATTLSLFTDQNAAYAIMKGACIDNGKKLVLEGAWRFPDNETTGLVRLYAGPESLVKELCENGPTAPADAVVTLGGLTGKQSADPSSALDLTFDHGLKQMGTHFVVVGHHGGCATTDGCGASENSLEAIRMTAAMGATIVEIDVQVSSDGVPFLFHDGNFSTRLTQGVFCHGPVESMTFANIRANCTLYYGEQIPTVDEALEAVLAEPDLRGVWFDLKSTRAMAPVVDAIEKHGGSTPKGGRGVHFVVGLSSEDQIDAYLALPPPKDVICLVEISADDTRRAGCQIWGPAWSNGPSAASVAALQAEGRATVFWTIDKQEFIDQYLQSSTANGFVSNRPGLVFHRYQTLGTVPPDRTQL